MINTCPRPAILLTTVDLLAKSIICAPSGVATLALRRPGLGSAGQWSEWHGIVWLEQAGVKRYVA